MPGSLTLSVTYHRPRPTKANTLNAVNGLLKWRRKAHATSQIY